VRSAAKEAIAELKAEQAREERRVEEKIEAMEIARGLAECSAFLSPSPRAYVSEGKKTYGSSISSGGSSSNTGTLGTAVMVILGLLVAVYALFAGIHLMKGNRQAESILARLVIVIVVSLVLILAVQRYI